jgi:excisionase family DNA binding protein
VTPEQPIRDLLGALAAERDVAIATAVAAAVAPLRGEIDQLRAEVAALRAALEQRAEPKVYVSPGEAAERLGVTTRTIRRRIKDGQLPTVRLGRIVRIPVAALMGEPAAAE